MPAERPKGLPDTSKLANTAKKSVFEKQKAEAEAKRQREEEETAAVYADFVKSFDDGGDEKPGRRSDPSGPPFKPSGAALGGSRRHFGASLGPSRGGLGLKASGPGSLGPAAPVSRKRALDGTPAEKDHRPGIFGFGEAMPEGKSALQDFHEDEETSDRARAQERAPQKPTIHLSSLPPGMSPAAIKAIFPANINIDAVRLLPVGQATSERKVMAAIVTLAADTPAVDIDTAVGSLQNRYLGWGFYLSLSRHLSSSVVGAGLFAPAHGSKSALPFGAKPVPINSHPALSRAPPPHQRAFAPPASYSTPGNFYGSSVQVDVVPPTDLRQIKLIHKTVEALLLHGPEFEALLMSRPSVQLQQKWAWLWDSSSVGGIWYRWRLWDILTGLRRRRDARGASGPRAEQLFAGGAAWSTAERTLPFEYTTALEDIVSDADYNSSSDEDSGDEGRRRLQRLQGGAPLGDSLDTEIPAYLNPFHKAKLIHLLSRLPTTNARLRRGDVARVTAFAIQHAGSGADEVVEIITSNVHSPLSLANIYKDQASEVKDTPTGHEDTETPKEVEDFSPAKLVALYLISDILSSSSTSGVRHAWRYRQLFEASLKHYHTFAYLGRLDKELSWGKLRAEKWKRSVSSILSLWEGWCVFPAHAQAEFVDAFEHPPLTTAEAEATAREADRLRDAEKKSARWKTVQAGPKEAADQRSHEMEDVESMGDVDGEAMEEDDVDGEPMEDSVDGEAMVEDEEAEEAAGQDTSRAGIDAADGKSHDEKDGADPAAIENHSHHHHQKDHGIAENEKITALLARRRRPKAEDMFADSDGE